MKNVLLKMHLLVLYYILPIFIERFIIFLIIIFIVNGFSKNMRAWFTVTWAYNYIIVFTSLSNIMRHRCHLQSICSIHIFSFSGKICSAVIYYTNRNVKHTNRKNLALQMLHSILHHLHYRLTSTTICGYLSCIPYLFVGIIK